MRYPPSEVLEAWPAPNYVDPETRGPALYVVTGLFSAFVLLAISLRLYARLVIRRWFGADDVFILLSIFFTTGLVISIILGNQRYGWDRHIWDVPPHLLSACIGVFFSCKIFFIFATTATRLSLLSFYYRLIKHSGLKNFRWVLHSSTVFVIVIWFLQMLLAIFQCLPPKAYFTFPPPPNAKCMNEGKSLVASAVINTLAELLLAVLPIPMILQLQLPLRTRWATAGLLCLGFLVVIAGCVRTYYVWLNMLGTYDMTWYSDAHWISALVELDLGIVSTITRPFLNAKLTSLVKVCACAPAIRPLFVQFFPGSSQLESSPPLNPDNKDSSQGNSPTETYEQRESKKKGASKKPSLYDLHVTVGSEDHEEKTNRYSNLWTQAGFEATDMCAAEPPLQTHDEEKSSEVKAFGNTTSITSNNTALPDKRSRRSNRLSFKGFRDRSASAAASRDLDELGLKIYTSRSMEMRESFAKDARRQSDMKSNPDDTIDWMISRSRRESRATTTTYNAEKADPNEFGHLRPSHAKRISQNTRPTVSRQSSKGSIGSASVSHQSISSFHPHSRNPSPPPPLPALPPFARSKAAQVQHQYPTPVDAENAQFGSTSPRRKLSRQNNTFDPFAAPTSPATFLATRTSPSTSSAPTSTPMPRSPPPPRMEPDAVPRGVHQFPEPEMGGSGAQQMWSHALDFIFSGNGNGEGGTLSRKSSMKSLGAKSGRSLSRSIRRVGEKGRERAKSRSKSKGRAWREEREREKERGGGVDGA
ncbi:hypothetical protein K402DRAFT_419144 [Aulographum hederae CBS 113979]|uniref:Rhodopsin domain-containing protein n=1 Tax=Aulographum hederae CBS 113979 TaxID=1176131 RepID=A0A6G1H6L1_9PEZI|nr:hypothetical protein K402DRAFT_419144 [Aulographum hederae CBS 113979]